jgi:uncharacterized tellurite resistance protein B-like protein
MLANFKNFINNLENDKLNSIVRESTGIRDKNIESLVKAAEDRSE